MSNKILFNARPNDDGKKFEYLKLKKQKFCENT